MSANRLESRLSYSRSLNLIDYYRVSVSWLAGNESDRKEEKLIVRILKLIALFDRFDSDGM